MCVSCLSWREPCGAWMTVCLLHISMADRVNSVQQEQQEGTEPQCKKRRQDGGGCPAPCSTGRYRIAALVLQEHTHSDSHMLLGSTLPVKHVTIFMGKPGSYTYEHVDLNAASCKCFPIVMPGFPLRLGEPYVRWWGRPPLLMVYLLMTAYGTIVVLEVCLGLKQLPQFRPEARQESAFKRRMFEAVFGNQKPHQKQKANQQQLLNAEEQQQQGFRQQAHPQLQAALTLGQELFATLQSHHAAQHGEVAEWNSDLAINDVLLTLAPAAAAPPAVTTLLRRVAKAVSSELVGLCSKTFLHLVGADKWVELGGVVVEQRAFQRVQPYPGFKHAVENLLPNLKVSVETARVEDAAACMYMQQKLRYRMAGANAKEDYMRNQQLIIDTAVQLAAHLGLY